MGGIDAHYKAHLNKGETDESYEDWWQRLCDLHKNPTSPFPEDDGDYLQSDNGLSIKRGYGHRGRFIRFKVKLENNTNYPIRNVKAVLDIPSSVTFESPISGESEIGDIESGETIAAEFMLKPLACTTATVKGYIVYKDIQGEIKTSSIRGKEIETCKPNLDSLPLTFAEITETISEKDMYKGSDKIDISGIKSDQIPPVLIKAADWMNMYNVNDVKHDNEFVFVGRQKVEKTLVITRTTLLPGKVKVKCYVEREDLIAGVLAEFAENLEELFSTSVQPSEDALWRVMDQFEEIDDMLFCNPKKDKVFTYLNKAFEIVNRIDRDVSREIEEFVNRVQVSGEGKKTLSESDVNLLRQNIDSWNETLRQKIQ